MSDSCGYTAQNEPPPELLRQFTVILSSYDNTREWCP